MSADIRRGDGDHPQLVYRILGDATARGQKWGLDGERMADPRMFTPRAKPTYRQHRPRDNASIYRIERIDGTLGNSADRALLEHCRRCNPSHTPIIDGRVAPGR